MSANSSNATSRDKARQKFEEDLGTSLIMDMFRDRNAKMKKAKKDGMIRELALKQKAASDQRRCISAYGSGAEEMSFRTPHNPDLELSIPTDNKIIGSYMGINEILRQSSCSPPPFAWKKRETEHQQLRGNGTKVPSMKDMMTKTQTELLILGMVQDEREKAHNKKMKIVDEPSKLPSDDMVRIRFGG